MPHGVEKASNMSLREFYIGMALAGIEARECRDIRPPGMSDGDTIAQFRADCAVLTADYIMEKLGYS